MTEKDTRNVGGSEAASQIPSWGTSKNIQWSETSLDESGYSATGNIDVKVSDTETKTYYYGYNKPADYTIIENQTIEHTETSPNDATADNPYIFPSGAGLSNPEGATTSINHILYQNNTSKGVLVNYSRNDKYATISGGAVYNKGELTEVIGDFVNNIVSGECTTKVTPYIGAANVYINGGAIANLGTIGDITGDFISNSASGTYADGGAIYNTATIGNITGDFINNSASGTYAYGGAIYNTAIIGNLTGDFVNNSASLYGGAIYNYGEDSSTNKIDNISGNFINNNAAKGGAIYNCNVRIGDITGNFVNNSGGAIYNSGTIGNIAGDFFNNNASGAYALGGAIGNYSNGKTAKIGNIEGDFINNSVSGSSYSYGGAIFNYAFGSGSSVTIGNITGDFINNSINSYEAYGGAISNYAELGATSTIGNITGNFINNSVSVPINNRYGASYGGAIYNNSTIGALDEDDNVVGGIINSNFIGNYAKSDASGTAQGGAIWTSTDLNIIADNATSTFKDNYTQVGETQDDNAIYVAGGATLTFKLSNNGQIYMYDNIRGEAAPLPSPQAASLNDDDNSQADWIPNSYKVNIQGDDINSTFFHMYNDMYDADLYLNNTTINTANNKVHEYALNTLTVTGDTNFIADVDLKNKEMDRFSAADYGTHSGNLNVIGMNLLSDATEGEQVTAIYFAQPGLKNNVTNGTSELPQEKYQNFTAYTPIFKYNVKYDNQNEYDGKGDGGYFLFTKGDKYFRPGGDTGNTGNPSDAFNPSVLSTPVSSVAAAQATVNETFKYVFEHADAFTQLPSMERMAHINANQYALSTDYNQNLGSLATEFNNHAGWFRPYVTFESMNLKNGPKVNATTYGSLVGFDSNFQTLGKGWTGLTTGYIGYNGSQLSYSGVDTTMNGGILGLTQTFYKGNFWTALTASAGASVGQSKTMYGNEDFTSLMAGIGSKTGYNFEFKEGKYILQPIMFLSYTFVNTFDYTNASGVKINADPAHSIQLNPSVRFIANTKNGWQPYASVGMVWNVMNENNVTANNVRLPEMSMKPYVEYGVGVQKRFKDKYTAFGQAMLRNGGRNGIALTAGFRWNLGKEGRPIEKVQTPSQQKLSQTPSLRGEGVNNQYTSQPPSLRGAQATRQSITKLNLLSQTDILARANNTLTTTTDRKIVKQLPTIQKATLGAKPQNTTRTTYRATLKQL